jgi:hypothetical protein
MLETIINLLDLAFALAGVAGIFVISYFGADFFVKQARKVSAETRLTDAQARHVDQTALVEKNTLEATIKAHEQNGANKLRTEIARTLGGDLAKIEAKIGSKITGAISLADHEAKLARSREIILALEAKVDALENPPAAAERDSSVSEVAQNAAL